MSVNKNDMKKKAVVFGGTDGHGVVMTGLSGRNLESEKFECRMVCEFIFLPQNQTELFKKKFWGTGNVGLFWGITFPNYSFSDLKEGDLVIVVDIPLGVDDRFPYLSLDGALKCIKDLTERGIRVIIIDHHKMAVTYYGMAREAGAEIVISSSAVTTHYGIPDEFSLEWGRVGAISDRDRGELPIDPDEERLSARLDAAVRSKDPLCIPPLLDALKTGKSEEIKACLDRFNPVLTVPENIECLDTVVEICDHLPQGYGNKVLGAACEKFDTDYGIGRTPGPDPAILVVTGWKREALPGALRLGLPSWKGHPDAFHYNFKGEEELTAALKEWKEQLNARDPAIPGTGSLPTVDRSDNYYRVIAAFMRRIGGGIPRYLTIHGWSHIENVLTNARTLGSLFNLKEDEQYLLDWAALLHDLGRGAGEVYRIKMDDLAKEKKDVDENHHLYSVMMIREWAQKGFFENFLNNDEIDAVADLCMRHRQKINPPEEPGWLRKLSIFLKIADAMDIDRRRAQKNDQGEYFEEIHDMPEDSVPHWLGHRAIKAVRVYARPDTVEFELIVTNLQDAEYQVKRFEKEIERLEGYFSFGSFVTEVRREVTTG